MRRFFIILFIISVAVNLVFKIRKNGRMHLGREKAKLFMYEKISYKEGYKYFIDKMTKRHPDINLKGKNSIICFWDSTNYEFMGDETMRDMDSVAGALGKYSFNYIFVTEMKEKLANDYLKRNGAENKNLSFVGDMDNFISSLYCDYPGKAKMIFIGDTSKNNKCFDKMRRHKLKPYYFIMDTAGNVFYHNNKCYIPSKDTAFMRIAKSSILMKPLQNL